MKKRFLLFLLAVFPLLANADESGTCGNNLTWTYVNATQTLTISGSGEMYGYSSSSSTPWGKKSLTVSVLIIENGVSSIGNYAFYNQSSLTSVTIPNSVTRIGECAFQYCGSLTSISIPNSVVRIGSSAFSGCGSLISINIPNSVTSIGSYAFSDCRSLTSINIPNSVTNIEDYTFQGCSSLTSINIPNSVTHIGRFAFKGCTSLTSVIISHNLTDIASDAFSDTAWFNSLPDGMAYAGKVAYMYKGTMPQNTAVSIKEGTLSIAREAFLDRSDLTTITIPGSVTSIGYYAFSGCTGLKKVIIPDIAAWCAVSFSESDPLNPLYFSQHLYSDENTEIKDLIIPNGVTTIGRYVFNNCTNLTSITIPESVTTIKERAFSFCSGLTSVTIGNSVTSIGNSAFQNCTSLTNITIPNSVTTIGGNAFYNCFRINTIYCLNPTPPTCNAGVFSLNSGSSEIYTYVPLHIPMGSGEIYSSSYIWRYFNRIKEDMELDGTKYYTNLIVQQGTSGYTRQAVKAGERFTIYIGSLGENKVNAVTFNGVDVTDEVVNGLYTTPEIKGESVLSISYNTSSSVSAPELKDVRVTGYYGEIKIKNIEKPSDIYVYSTDGKLIESLPATQGTIDIQVPSNQLYIVKIGSQTYKLAM